MFDSVDHIKLWKVFREMGISKYLICFHVKSVPDAFFLFFTCRLERKRLEENKLFALLRTESNGIVTIAQGWEPWHAVQTNYTTLFKSLLQTLCSAKKPEKGSGKTPPSQRVERDFKKANCSSICLFVCKIYWPPVLPQGNSEQLTIIKNKKDIS